MTTTSKSKEKVIPLLDRMELLCDKLTYITEMLIAVEHERDFYKNQYSKLQDKLKSIVIDYSSAEKKGPPEYVTLTGEQMDVAKISFPHSSPQEAYQQYSNNILSLRDEGRLRRGKIIDIGVRENV